MKRRRRRSGDPASVRQGGTLTLVGITRMGERASFDVYRLLEEGKQIRGSNYGSATPSVDFPRIARLYADGRLPLNSLVVATTARFAMPGSATEPTGPRGVQPSRAFE